MNDFLSGAVLGACISTLSFPFSVAKVQLQKDVQHRPGMSVFRAIKEVIVWAEARAVRRRERGSVLGLYNGAKVNFCRALISWGIVNAVYERFGVLFPNN